MGSGWDPIGWLILTTGGRHRPVPVSHNYVGRFVATPGHADRLLLLKNLAGKTGGLRDFKNRTARPFHISNMGSYGKNLGFGDVPDDFGNYGFGVAMHAMDVGVYMAAFFARLYPNSPGTWWNTFDDSDRRDRGNFRLFL